MKSSFKRLLVSGEDKVVSLLSNVSELRASIPLSSMLPGQPACEKQHDGNDTVLANVSSLIRGALHRTVLLQ